MNCDPTILKSASRAPSACRKRLNSDAIPDELPIWRRTASQAFETEVGCLSAAASLTFAGAHFAGGSAPNNTPKATAIS